MDEFSPKTRADFENALKQIIQEVALLGLERGGFFEKAAFYGGTALRLLHGLPRFSEDLDFTLFRPEPKFDLSGYFRAVETEQAAYGFEAKIGAKAKTKDTEIDSAFIRAETRIHPLRVRIPGAFSGGFQKGQQVQIKFEVDTHPALGFQSELRALLNPTSFEVVTLALPDLFAGKMHAVLFRACRNRAKGRDFYDLLLYLKHSVPLRLEYLKEKMIQGGKWSPSQPFEREDVIGAFKERIKKIDFEQAVADVLPFIQDRESLKVWKTAFFDQVIDQLKTV
jgi:predicted nucleotidyltransferase component of viral defense system